MDKKYFLEPVVCGFYMFWAVGAFSAFQKLLYPDPWMGVWTINCCSFRFHAIIIAGVLIMQNTGKEFMPSLNEGSFLFMPTSLPHAGVEENKRVLQQLDMAVASIPEIETVVGKAGRTESALDPAPLSMYENIIQYKPEYMLNEEGKHQRYKVNEDGFLCAEKWKTCYLNPNTGGR